MIKKQLIEQCLLEHPTMTQVINNVERELTEEERLETASAWADMRLQQIALEEQLAAEAEAKAEAEAAEQQKFNDAVAQAVAAALATLQTPQE
jgi:L-lactate utilization protein LutC